MDKSLDIKIDPRNDFEALFHEFSDVIYRLCLYKTSNESVAHDLTQETFLRLWKSMSSDKNIEKPKQYIYQIARNLIVDYYKSKKSVSLEILEEAGFEPKSEENNQEILAEVSILKDAIEELDQDFRDVIYLKFIEDMRVQDIAEMLGISENLASVRISRGKEKLRLKFE